MARSSEPSGSRRETIMVTAACLFALGMVVLVVLVCSGRLTPPKKSIDDQGLKPFASGASIMSAPSARPDELRRP